MKLTAEAQRSQREHGEGEFYVSSSFSLCDLCASAVKNFRLFRLKWGNKT